MSMPDNGQSESVVTMGAASPELIASLTAASSADSTPDANQAGDTTAQVGTGTPEATPDATGQPASAEPTGSQPGTDRTPQHRIEAAVRNAREQARAEVMREFQAFQGINPDDARLGIQVLSELRADPEKFFRELGQRINGGQGQQVEEEAIPEADIVSKDGQLKTYRAETLQKVLDIHGRRVMAQVMKDLKPFVDFAQTEQQTRREQQQEAQVRSQVNEALTEARQLPHFKDNETAILEALRAMPVEMKRAKGPVASLYAAYHTVLKDRVFPSIDQAAEGRVRQQLSRKEATSMGSAHPVDQSGNAKPAIRNESELAAHMARLAASASA
jgi:hypothetical protein